MIVALSPPVACPAFHDAQLESPTELTIKGPVTQEIFEAVMGKNPSLRPALRLHMFQYPRRGDREGYNMGRWIADLSGRRRVRHHFMRHK
jgi:hypothetical protein